MINQYDQVRLKTGKLASIVEIWELGVSYEADVEIEPGEYSTETIKHSDIMSVFVEMPLQTAM